MWPECFKFVWITLSLGFLVLNVWSGSIQECKHSDRVSFQMAAVLGSEFELPLCWQSKDYNITYTAINNKTLFRVNNNTSNIWLASRANVRGHIGDQVIVFLIDRVGIGDIKNHQVRFHPYGKWITIHVNLTRSAVTESTVPESTNINKVESVCEDEWQYIENRCTKLFKAANWSAAVTTCHEAGAKLTNGLFNRSVYKQDITTWIKKVHGLKCYLQEKKNINVLGDCSVPRKYFCEKKCCFDGKCESTWQHVGDKCIEYFDKQTWSRAVKTCQNNGANLTHGDLDYELYFHGSSPTWINKSDGSLCSFMQRNNYTETPIPCNKTRIFFCEKSQDPPNVTHFNLKTNVQGEDNTTQDLLHTTLELISVDQQSTSLVFTCNASGAYNVTIMNDEKIKATGINSVTYQKSLSEPTLCFESAEYSCVAHNNFGVSRFSRKIQGTCKLQIESFFASTKKKSVENVFISEVNETGVNVQCTTNRVFGASLKIQHKGKVLADTRTAKVHYSIPHVKCRDIGEYVCLAEDVRTRTYKEDTIQLAVSNCQAQLCSTADQSKTIKAKVHDNVTVSFCFIIYQEQFKEPKLYMNNTVIESTQLFNIYNWSLDSYEHLNKTINLHKHDINPEDFGLQYIHFEFNGHNTSMLLDIQAEGPPSCPTNLTIQDIGSDYVRLSWTPGFNGGAEQQFRIVYKKLNETPYWTLAVQKTTMDSLGRMHATIDRLESGTIYELRVTSSNSFGHQSEEPGLCHAATTGTTETEVIEIRPPFDPRSSVFDPSCATYKAVLTLSDKKIYMN